MLPVAPPRPPLPMPPPGRNGVGSPRHRRLFALLPLPPTAAAAPIPVDGRRPGGVDITGRVFAGTSVYEYLGRPCVEANDGGGGAAKT